VQVAGFLPKTTHHFVVRAVNAANAEDDNEVEVSATTDDDTPPVFEGVQSLDASGSTILVSFAPAVDNADPPTSTSTCYLKREEPERPMP
jgi:hypothetical protein